jgi:hypothetical protein
MKRTMICAWLAAAAAALAASCSNQPERLVSPSAVTESDTALNSDGSSVKATAPSELAPNGGTLNTRQPTLAFTNSTALFVQATLSNYEVEIQDAAGAVVYTRVIGQAPGRSQHTVEVELAYATTYWWRARGRLDAQQNGPWSGFAQIRTPDPPPPPTTTTTTTVPPTPTTPTTPTAPASGLQFPPPAACAAGGFACVAAVAALSDEWGACARGIGVGCHRFTRQVVAALSSFDPGWQMIQAAPGGHACNCSGCGPSDGTMFREDTTVYRGRDVYDMIVGAGGPSPSLSWGFVGAPRNVDVPNNAPVCRP